MPWCVRNHCTVLKQVEFVLLV